MANTYTQIFLHIVFAVRKRQKLISLKWEAELFKYISVVVRNKGHKCLAINGMPDHIHILIGYKPVHALPDLIREIKKSSSAWINSNKLEYGRFNWQSGYGAFSIHLSQLSRVIRYIENQKSHHNRYRFESEYKSILEEYEISYNEKYLFDF